MFKNLGKRLSESITEINSTYWSLTKIGILVFMYPTITFLIIFDTLQNNRMDWLNAAVFITGVVAPRMVSQIVAARFGFTGNMNTPNDTFTTINDSNDVSLKK